MRVSIVVPDDVVVVDGVAAKVPLASLAEAGVHAIQWDGAAGHIEFADPEAANESVDSTETFDWVIAAHADALTVVEPEPEPVRRLVLKSLIIQRLHDAELLSAAAAALDADLYARERWYAPDKPGIYADDAEAIALLTAIGADVEAILAPP